MLPLPQKTVSSLADLAINGAAAMFPEPLHVGRPNIGSKEAFLAEGLTYLGIGR